MRTFFLITIIMILVSCTKKIDGKWEAKTEDTEYNSSLNIVLIISENDGIIEGVGTVRNKVFTVTGTHINKKVILNLSKGNRTVMIIPGTLQNENKITGMLYQEPIVFYKIYE